MPRQNGRTLALKKRRAEVMELKISGMTENAIAEKLGVSRSVVQNDVSRYLGEMAKSNAAGVLEVRALQMERYGKLMLTWWDVATNPYCPVELRERAFQNVMKVLNRIDVINGIVPRQPNVHYTQQVNQQNVDQKAEVKVEVRNEEPKNLTITSEDVTEAFKVLAGSNVLPTPENGSTALLDASMDESEEGSKPKNE